MISIKSRSIHRLLSFDQLEQRTMLVAGLTAIGNQYWHQDLDSIDDVAESLDAFGRAVAAGDFNADSFEDLAIGVPGESVEQLDGAGAVNVIYGTSDGLMSLASQFWSQGSTGIVSDLEAGDRFGSALAAGDFNGDNVSDLAIGVPRESVDGLPDAGGVNVIYGTTSFGLTNQGNQFWTQRETVGDLEAGDRFGSVLAAGDFNQDGFDDLAIGAPLESIAGVTGAGGVNVIYGSSTGLTTGGNQFWSQNSTDILNEAGTGDHFGAALAAGDFNRDGFDELAIGAPGETIGGQADAGAINVIYGSTDGLDTFDNQFWHRNVEGILGTPRTGDEFASALAAGDLNRDGRDDLAVGVPGDRVGGVNNAGGVNVLLGSTLLGLTATGNQLWHQEDITVGLAISNSRFGRSLATGNFDASAPLRPDDLAIGGNGNDGAGLVNVLYGSTAGLATIGAQTWQQGTLDDGELVQGNMRPNEDFSAALAVGDFDNNGLSDLAVGVPGDTIDRISAGFGAANVLYGFDVLSAPVVADDFASTGLSSPVLINPLENDFDLDGVIDPTTVVIQSDPENGTAMVDPVTGAIRYVPGLGFFGIDQMSYTVRDDRNLESDEAMIVVTVAGWWNANNPLDVTADGTIAPNDALSVINELNNPQITDESGRIELSAKPPDTDFLDVNGDNFVAPMDALLVINFLNDNPMPRAALKAVTADLHLRDEPFKHRDSRQLDSFSPLQGRTGMPVDLRLIDAAFDQDAGKGNDVTGLPRAESDWGVDLALLATSQVQCDVQAATHQSCALFHG